MQLQFQYVCIYWCCLFVCLFVCLFLCLFVVESVEVEVVWCFDIEYSHISL